MDPEYLRKEKIFEAIKKNDYDYVSGIKEKDANMEDFFSKPALNHAIDKNDIKMVKLLLKKKAKINSRDYFGNTPIMIAAASGNLEIVKILVENNANINDTNKYGWSVFMLAVSSGNKELLNYLFEKKINIHYQNTQNNNALMWASGNRYIRVKKHFHTVITRTWGNKNKIKFKGKDDQILTIRFALRNNLEIMKLLIKYGLDINHYNKDGYTALIDSIDSDNIESVKWLLENGANVNSKDKNKTPLIEAAKQGNIDIIKLLIEHKADPTICDNNKYTPYVYAVKNNNVEAIEYLKKMPINCSNYYKSVLYHIVNNKDYEILEKMKFGSNFTYKEYENAIIKAIKSNSFESFKIILENGNFEDYNEILLQALKSGNKDMVEKLLKSNFKLNKSNNEFYEYLIKKRSLDKLSEIPKYLDETNKITPLMIAASWQDLELIKLILSKNEMTLNEINLYGYNALAYSIRNGDNNINDFLIDEGIDTKLSLNDGKTLIMYAIEKKAHKLAYKLIKKEKNLEKLYYRYNNWSLLEYASKYDAINILNYLFENGVKYNSIRNKYSALILASRNSSQDALKILIKNNANVNENLHKYSPLMHAIMENKYENVRFLIEKKANLKKEDGSWWSPLLFAARFANLETFKLILRNTSEKNKLSDNKRNIFMLAAIKKNNTEVLKEVYSLRKKIKINIENTDIWGNTALLLAIKNNNIENVKYLLSIGANYNTKNIFGFNSYNYAKTRGYKKILKELEKIKKL
jgi:ankyrin repeat protein